MKLYVLDSNAIVRYLEAGKDWEKVRTLIEKAGEEEVKLFISVINWGEAMCVAAKKAGLERAVAYLKTLGTAIDIIPAGEADTEAAVAVKHNYKLGYADSFAAALAIRLNATLVTADPEFAKLGKKLKVMPLQRHNE